MCFSSMFILIICWGVVYSIFIVFIFHVFWYLYSNNVFGFYIPVIVLDLYIPIETFMGYPGLYIFQRRDVSFVGEMSGNPGRAPN